MFQTSQDRLDLHAGDFTIGSAEGSNLGWAANHKQTVSVMHIDVSRASFHGKVQRLVLRTGTSGETGWALMLGNWSVEEEYARQCDIGNST